MILRLGSTFLALLVFIGSAPSASPHSLLDTWAEFRLGWHLEGFYSEFRETHCVDEFRAVENLEKDRPGIPIHLYIGVRKVDDIKATANEWEHAVVMPVLEQIVSLKNSEPNSWHGYTLPAEIADFTYRHTAWTYVTDRFVNRFWMETFRQLAAGYLPSDVHMRRHHAWHQLTKCLTSKLPEKPWSEIAEPIQVFRDHCVIDWSAELLDFVWRMKTSGGYSNRELYREVSIAIGERFDKAGEENCDKV